MAVLSITSASSAPWLGDKAFGGMSPASAEASWRATQRRREEEAARTRDHGARHAETPVARHRFVPVAIDDVQLSTEPAWLIDGVLPARGLACIVGEPKSGKSFFTSDMLMAVARGVPYAGRAASGGPVVYLTGEGVNGFKRRLVAMREHLGLEGKGVPFFMIDNVPDLGSTQTDLPNLLADLEKFLATDCTRPRAIALDTLARCMGEADENSARDMGRFVNRCAAIERHFGCVVVVVHHVGKNPERGGRGSNALNGAADVTMLVEKFETYSRVRIEEMKDGREGQEWSFRLEPYDLNATLEAGCAPPSATSDNSTCVVKILSEPGNAQPSATSKKVAPPSGVAGDLLKIIRRAVDEAGTTTTDSAAVPSNVRAVSRDNLKRYCETMAWQEGAEARSWSAQLSNNLSKLRDKAVIGFDKGWVWPT